MPFTHNAKGAKPTPGGKQQPVPAGKYLLSIYAAKPQIATSGRNMVVVDSSIEDKGPFFGRKIRFHNVVFVEPGEPGAGMCLWFLKCIGEPYEGDNLDIDEARWKTKRFVADVGLNEKGYNTIMTVYPGPDASPETQAEIAAAAAKAGDEVPF